jgi:exosortase A
VNRVIEAKAGIFERASSWTLAAIAFATATIVLLVCYWQTVESLVWVWDHDGTYQYAFLIFPLAAWIVFDQRHRVRANPPVPSLWGLATVILLACVWYAGRLLDINLVQHFAFVALFPALVLACWGWRALRVLVFPLAYLVIFAVPWGDGLVGPLQDITAHFAVHALELTGTPVLLNGREIVTPSAVWMVADACSGVKFFLACTALGCLYAWLMYQRWWKRVLFVVLAAVVPIIANGFRVYFTVLIGDTWGLHYATGTDHMIFGWQFFGTVLVLLLLAGWFFRDRFVAREVPPPTNGRPVGTRAVVWVATLAALIAGPALAARAGSTVARPEQVQLVAPAVAGWLGPHPAADGWRPSFEGAAAEVQASYRSAMHSGEVELFHAVYTGKPRRGHSLITYGNNVYDAAKARVLASSALRVEFAGGASVAARELRLADAEGPRMVWYWYCVDSRCTASPALTKLLQAWDILRGGDSRSSVWALSAPVARGDEAQARADLRAFSRVLSAARGAKS